MWTKKVLSMQEDDSLRICVALTSKKKWKLVNAKMRTQFSIMDKTPKQCRDRWINYVNPDLIKTCSWTKREDQKLLEKYKEYGNKWTCFRSFLPGRSEGIIKNRFYCIIRKNIRGYNIDKPECEQIKGSIKLLLTDPFMIEILVAIPNRKRLITKRETFSNKGKITAIKPTNIKSNGNRIEENLSFIVTRNRKNEEDGLLNHQSQGNRFKTSEYGEYQQEDEAFFDKKYSLDYFDDEMRGLPQLTQSYKEDKLEMKDLRLPEYEFCSEYEYRK